MNAYITDVEGALNAAGLTISETDETADAEGGSDYSILIRTDRGELSLIWNVGYGWAIGWFPAGARRGQTVPHALSANADSGAVVAEVLRILAKRGGGQR